MIPMRVLMIEDHSGEVERFRAYVKGRKDMELVGAVDGEQAGLLAVIDFQPDVVILDLDLREGDGIQFISKMKKLELRKMPFILVTTWTSEETVIRHIKASGAGHVLGKYSPNYEEKGPEKVCQLLWELRPVILAPPPPPAADRDTEDREKLRRARVRECIGRVSNKQKNKGFHYLVECVTIIGGLDKWDWSMVDDVYPELERRLGVGAVNAERAMRVRIEYIWAHTSTDTLREEYGAYYSDRTGRPEVVSFLCYYANRLGD